MVTHFNPTKYIIDDSNNGKDKVVVGASHSNFNIEQKFFLSSTLTSIYKCKIWSAIQ